MKSVPILVYVVLAFAIGFALGRYRAFAFLNPFQNRGEALLSRVARA